MKRRCLQIAAIILALAVLFAASGCAKEAKTLPEISGRSPLADMTEAECLAFIREYEVEILFPTWDDARLGEFAKTVITTAEMNPDSPAGSGFGYTGNVRFGDLIGIAVLRYHRNEEDGPFLADMTEEECLAFIRDAEVEIPPELADMSDAELGKFAKATIEFAEAYPDFRPGYAAGGTIATKAYDDARRILAGAIGLAVGAYHGFVPHYYYNYDVLEPPPAPPGWPPA